MFDTTTTGTDITWNTVRNGRAAWTDINLRDIDPGITNVIASEPIHTINMPSVSIYDIASKIAKYIIDEIESKIGFDFDEDALEDFLSANFKDN